MSMSNTAEAALWAHYFNNAAVANVGDAAGPPGYSNALLGRMALRTRRRR